jgi:hypothetical protein
MGMVPIVTDADSFKQWFTDDPPVNQTFAAVLEMPSVGTNLYQYASWAHLAQGGFFPLDKLGVVAGLRFLCSNKVGPGHICHSELHGQAYGVSRRLS